MSQYSRRGFLGTAVAFASLGIRSRAVRAGELLDRAHEALQRHADHIVHADVMGIADFSLPSSARRFHLLNLRDGSVSSYLVAHGRGSDPAHTGWLQRFSNELHSNATSRGAYLTGNPYVGAHGRSIRLSGLDASDSNAEPRAIVVHAAWYVSAEMARKQGLIGRSDGCFALDQANLEEILRALGPGRLLYADKIQSSQAGQ